MTGRARGSDRRGCAPPPASIRQAETRDRRRPPRAEPPGVERRRPRLNKSSPMTDFAVRQMSRTKYDNAFAPCAVRCRGRQFLRHAVRRRSCPACRARRARRRAAPPERRPPSSAVSTAPMIQPDRRNRRSRARHHLADGGEDFDFDDGRRRSDRVDVALVELAKPAARRTVRAPHRLNLIALEELRQLVLILRDDASERHGQVVPERQVRLAGSLVLAPFQDLENELVALFAVLAEQRLDVLEGRRLERLETVALVHTTNDIDHVLTTPNVVGQKITRPSRWFGRLLVCHYM